MDEPTEDATIPASDDAERTAQRQPEKDPDGPSMTADEEEALANKLRDLGYIE